MTNHKATREPSSRTATVLLSCLVVGLVATIAVFVWWWNTLRAEPGPVWMTPATPAVPAVSVAAIPEPTVSPTLEPATDVSQAKRLRKQVRELDDTINGLDAEADENPHDDTPVFQLGLAVEKCLVRANAYEAFVDDYSEQAKAAGLDDTLDGDKQTDCAPDDEASPAPSASS